MPLTNDNGQGPVILSQEPVAGNVHINIQDPNKPKSPPKYVNKLPPKETVGTKLKHAFLGPEVDKVGEYVVKEYLEPAGKRMLNNASQNILKKIGDGIQILLFGKIVSTQSGGVDYTSFYNPNIAPGQQQAPKAYKLLDAVDTFTFRTNADAQAALNYLRGRIATYKSVSVADYYENIGAAVDYMMVDRGWLNLDNARVISTPDGFIIDLPRPILLKRG